MFNRKLTKEQNFALLVDCLQKLQDQREQSLTFGDSAASEVRQYTTAINQVLKRMTGDDGVERKELE